MPLGLECRDCKINMDLKAEAKEICFSWVVGSIIINRFIFQVSFFNNYLMDPKRPSLPEHPGNKTAGGPPPGPQSHQYPNPASGYGGPPHMGYNSHRGGGGPHMMRGGYGGG